jgi:Predicted membrane protein/domain
MNIEMDKKISIEYAGFVIRLAAMFVDGFIVLTSLYIINFGINFMGFNLSFLDFVLPLSNVRISLLYLVLPVAYWTFFESSAIQATIGKRIAGIMVIDENGKRLSVTKACARAVFRNITLFLCIYLIGLIGIVTMDFNKRKQTLYDIIAKTCVIKGKPVDFIEKPIIQTGLI